MFVWKQSLSSWLVPMDYLCKKAGWGHLILATELWLVLTNSLSSSAIQWRHFPYPTRLATWPSLSTSKSTLAGAALHYFSCLCRGEELKSFTCYEVRKFLIIYSTITELYLIFRASNILFVFRTLCHFSDKKVMHFWCTIFLMQQLKELKEIFEIVSK